MIQLPPHIWVLLAAIAAIACLGALYVLAARVRDEMAIRDVRARAEVIRENYLKYLESLHSGNGGDVDIIDEPAINVDIVDAGPATEPAPAAPAPLAAAPASETAHPARAAA